MPLESHDFWDTRHKETSKKNLIEVGESDEEENDMIKIKGRDFLSTSLNCYLRQNRWGIFKYSKQTKLEIQNAN